MNSKTHTKVRRLAPLALVLVALAVAACGSNSSSSSSSSPAPASTQSSSPSTGGSSGATKNGIPQGPNAGDRDADNSGGPSDGDGNI